MQLFQQVVLRWIARDFQGMKLATNRIIALTATKDLRMYKALGNLSAAVLDAEIENSSDGIERIRDGLSSYRKMGYGLHVSFYLLCLSRVHLCAREYRAASMLWTKPYHSTNRIGDWTMQNSFA